MKDDLLKGQDINCTLEWNQGNHFKDVEIRTAKAFSWVMKQHKDTENETVTAAEEQKEKGESSYAVFT